MCRARAADSLSQTLHRTSNRSRPHRSLDAAKDRVFGRDYEVARESELKGATKCSATNGSDRRDLQGFKGAEGLIAFGNEGPELIAVLLQEVEHIASLAEIGAFRSHEQCPDVTLAGFVDGLLERIREVRSDEI